MKKLLLTAMLIAVAPTVHAFDFVMQEDVALAEVPVNIYPLVDATDGVTIETAIAYNEAGMDLVWNFVTADGAATQTAVTPTTAGDYDWVHLGDGIYTIEIPASGGVSINNDTAGYGWFSGNTTASAPWRGPVIMIADTDDTATGMATTTDLDRASGVLVGYQQIATYTSQTSFTIDQIVPEDADSLNGHTVVIYETGTSDVQVGIISDYSEAGGIGTVTLESDPGVFTYDGNDYIIVLNGYVNMAAAGGGGISTPESAASGLATAGNNHSTERGLAGTALPLADADTAGGLPISDAGGLNMDLIANGPVINSTTVSSVTSTTVYELTSASADDDAYNNAIAVFRDASSGAQKSFRRVTDYTGGATMAITVESAPDFTVAISDFVEIIVNDTGTNLDTDANNRVRIVDGTGAGEIDTDAGGVLLSSTALTNVNTQADTALSDIGLDHLISASVTGTDVADNSIISSIVDDHATTRDWDNYNPIVHSLKQLGDSVGAIPDLGSGSTLGFNMTDLGVYIGVPSNLGSGASLAANLVDVEGQTDDIGAAGVGLSDIPWNASWDAEVESEVDDSIGGGTGTSLTAIPWNASWDTEVESEANDALVAIHLDHLLSADYDPASKPGTATALFNELIEDDGGVSRYTTNALEQAGGGGDGSGFTSIPWNSAWDTEVESEANDALVANHLDHLLAADYDPASKPGVSTALLNEIFEDDGGVSRYTTNALENAGSATVDAVDVPPSRTHYIEGSTSRSVITVQQNSAITIKLVPELTAGTAIQSVTSCALTGAASVTGTNTRTTTDYKAALADLAALSTTGTYTATWTIVTTDAQTLVLTGTLIVE